MKKIYYDLFKNCFIYCKITNVSKKLNYSILTHYSGTPSMQQVFIPPISIKRFASSRDAILKVQELLNIKKIRGNNVVLSDFSKISKEQIENNYKLCLSYGLTNETLKIYPNILADQSLLFKLDLLKSLPFNINKVVPLLDVYFAKLEHFINEEKNKKRIMEFAKIFQVDESTVCKWMLSKQFLMTINIDNMKITLNLLLDSGVTHTQIIQDLWVLRYSPSAVKKRIGLAKENNIDNIKTWMVRAQSQIFENYARRRSDNKDLLGENTSLTEYLSDKLQCSEEVSKFIIAKHPALQKKCLRKMNEMIDFLLKKDFKTIQICRTPKILLHSVETIKKRLKEVEANNMQLNSLVVLTKSHRQYMHHLDTMKSKKSSK